VPNADATGADVATIADSQHKPPPITASPYELETVRHSRGHLCPIRSRHSLRRRNNVFGESSTWEKRWMRIVPVEGVEEWGFRSWTK
jgi:hypothetical protein